jgi:2-dehydro-3-deoxygluconokinase
MVALALAEGLAANLILRIPGRVPALSLVERGRSGERVSRIWGEGAPARELFELPDWMRIAQSLIAARLVYFSGITLSLYSNNGLGRFFAALEVARQQGAKVAFDGNFRPSGWKGNLARTRSVFMEALKRVDIALPAFDDEAVLWGDPSPESTVARLQAFGVGEIVVKNGPNSAIVAAGTTSGVLEAVPVPEILVPIDPTAAGDGFNAGYLAARLSGSAPAQAASAAHRLAGNIISHAGALLPRAEAAVH